MKKTMIMKKITILSLAIAGFFGCTDNDDTAPIVLDGVEGTYRMVSFNAPVSQDLNGDGDGSFNLATENSCYTDWQLMLNSDNTYTKQGKIVSIADGNIVCEVETETGTWERDDEMVTLTNIDGTQIGSEFSFIDENNSLTQTRSGTFPLQFEQGFTMESGTVTLIYVRD